MFPCLHCMFTPESVLETLGSRLVFGFRCLVSLSLMLYIVHSCHHCTLWPVGGEDCWPLTLLSMLTACRLLVLVLNTSYILILMKALFFFYKSTAVCHFKFYTFMFFIISYQIFFLPYSTFQCRLVSVCFVF